MLSSSAQFSSILKDVNVQLLYTYMNMKELMNVFMMINDEWLCYLFYELPSASVYTKYTKHLIAEGWWIFNICLFANVIIWS